MRLDKEDVKDIKEALICDKDRRPLSYTCCIELFETIEGLYGDVDSLMEQLNRNIFAMDDAEAKIEALQQENEQLQAQLDEWKYEAKCHMDEVAARDKEIERLEAQVDTLSATVNMLAPDEIGKECRHIEALRQAREALEYCIDTLAPMAAVSHLNGQKGKMQEVCEEALATIDKVIGEKEDAGKK